MTQHESCRDSVLHALALWSVPGIGPRTYGRIVTKFGSAENVLKAPMEQLRKCGLLSGAVRAGIRRARERLGETARVLQTLHRRGVSIAEATSPNYPAALRLLKDGPALMFALGRSELADGMGVAIVGTTRPSLRGATIAEELAARIAAAGRCVVSGYAHGIDTAAHLGALRAGGSTVLVVPTGILAFRWRGAFRWVGGLAERTLVLSEQPPWAGWASAGAIARNRLIVALSRAVVFVETLARPAAVQTFRRARESGRVVYVVQYRRAPRSAAGNETMVRMGGVPVRCFADVERILAECDTAPAAQRAFDW
mgnify:CR=1 FL=1